MTVRRDTGLKASLSLTNIGESIKALLETIQSEMLEKARKEMNDHIVVVTEWKNFVPNLNKNNIVVIPWCEEKECEEAIKKLSAEEYVVFSLYFLFKTRS